MNLRSLRLRAVGPPLAVAAICAAALFWFDRIWIPTQQQYLNERNLRALRTISTQIKAKVDNFDQAIDHAIDSFPIEDGNADLQKDLQKYVKLFSPELEIVTFDRKSPAWTKVTPGDPPNVRIQRDEGRNYLYLGYLHEKAHRTGSTPIALIARGDIDKVAEPLLARTDFDALLLLDGNGATIAQQSSSGLELTSIDKVRDRGPIAAPNQPGVFDRMRGTTGVAVVTIGAADYMLYTQPVQLSLVHEERKAGVGFGRQERRVGSGRMDAHRAGPPRSLPGGKFDHSHDVLALFRRGARVRPVCHSSAETSRAQPSRAPHAYRQRLDRRRHFHDDGAGHVHRSGPARVRVASFLPPSTSSSRAWRRPWRITCARRPRRSAGR